MEMFNILRLNAKKQIEKIRAAFDVEIPIRARDVARHKNAIAMGQRLSYLETSHPETGSPNNELMGIKSRIVPSSASLYPKVVLMVGIRDAHEAKQNPDKKKKILSEMRCLVRSSILIARR